MFSPLLFCIVSVSLLTPPSVYSLRPYFLHPKYIHNNSYSILAFYFNIYGILRSFIFIPFLSMVDNISYTFIPNDFYFILEIKIMFSKKVWIMVLPLKSVEFSFGSQLNYWTIILDLSCLFLFLSFWSGFILVFNLVLQYACYGLWLLLRCGFLKSSLITHDVCWDLCSGRPQTSNSPRSA